MPPRTLHTIAYNSNRVAPKAHVRFRLNTNDNNIKKEVNRKVNAKEKHSH